MPSLFKALRAIAEGYPITVMEDNYILVFVGRIRGRYARLDKMVGFVVEADAIPGLMHIYPQEALDLVSDPDQLPLGL